MHLDFMHSDFVGGEGTARQFLQRAIVVVGNRGLRATISHPLGVVPGC